MYYVLKVTKAIQLSQEFRKAVAADHSIPCGHSACTVWHRNLSGFCAGHEFPETRLVVGCADLAQGTMTELEQRGYTVTSQRSEQPPVRLKEEKDRASKLIAETFKST